MPWLQATERRAAACAVGSAGTGSVLAGALLATWLHPDPHYTVWGIGVLVALAILAALALTAARSGQHLAAAFWLVWPANVLLASALAYLAVGFRIF